MAVNPNTMFRLRFERTATPGVSVHVQFILVPVDEKTGAEGSSFVYQANLTTELKSLSKAVTGIDFVTGSLFHTSAVVRFSDRAGKEHKYCFKWPNGIDLEFECINTISKALTDRIQQVLNWVRSIPQVEYFELEVYPILRP